MSGGSPSFRAVCLFLLVTVLCALAFRHVHAQPPPTELRVGYLPATHDSLLFIALERRLFPGDVRVVPVRHTNSGEILQKLEAGDLDMGIPGIAAPARYIGSQSPFIIVGGAATRSAALVVAASRVAEFSFVTSETLKPAEVDRIFDTLKGKRIGTVTQSTGDSIFRSAVARRRLGPSVSIQTKQSPSDILNDLQAGSLDAGVLWSPHMTRAESMGMRIVLWMDQLLQNHVCCRLVARNEYVKQHPAAVTSFLTGILKANQEFSKLPSDTVFAILNRYLVPTLSNDALRIELYGDQAKGIQPRTSISPDIYAGRIAEYLVAMRDAELLSTRQSELVERGIVQLHMARAYKQAFPALTEAQSQRCAMDGFNKCPIPNK